MGPWQCQAQAPMAPGPWPLVAPGQLAPGEAPAPLAPGPWTSRWPLGLALAPGPRTGPWTSRWAAHRSCQRSGEGLGAKATPRPARHWFQRSGER